MSDERTAARVQSQPGFTQAELGVDHTDGYRVTVGWSEDDDAWLARLTGCQAEASPLGTGSEKLTALLDLACSLACLSDAMHDAEQATARENAASREAMGKFTQEDVRMATVMAEDYERVGTYPDSTAYWRSLASRIAVILSRAVPPTTES